ncbi:hypothetical protein NEF87_001867 [Candidatus Lokiarchaeum ossiferum]|uniref:ABC3 transporter permease protein domain-containing protein n=1 Tax=Candidatus Lokiarchaeum ossiferum TaxID=2951803 RepID=A0ABY6HRT5_9ARCH|nr:hypothetical protein NEF87_001867 [Candidatus Lokiarchaeum sp. B-35]
MSVNFAVKDLYFHSHQTKSTFWTNSTLIGMLIYFQCLNAGFGADADVIKMTIASFSVISFFYQYSSLLIKLIYILTVVLVIGNNHAIILSRKKDIASMKSTGCLPNLLYSYYLFELLFLVIINFAVGALGSVFFYIISYYIISSGIPSFKWVLDLKYGALLLVILILVTFFLNGAEIRKIGNKTYNQTKTGHIQDQMRAKLGKFWKKWLANKPVSMIIAIKNLKRKKYHVQQFLIIISIAGLVLFVSIIGALTIGLNNKQNIRDAQSKNILIIAADPIISSMEAYYNKFNDPTTDITVDIECENLLYNLTDFEPQLLNLLSNYSIDNIDHRLYSQLTVNPIMDSAIKSSLIATNPFLENSFKDCSSKKYEKLIPLQGIDSTCTSQNWKSIAGDQFNGSGVAIGDTLANAIFDYPLSQKIRLNSSKLGIDMNYPINSIVADSLNNGNSAYLSLKILQNIFDRPNFVNLLLIDFNSLLQTSNNISLFLKDVENLISNELGENFRLLDLTPTFKQNLQIVGIFQNIFLVISLVISVVILYLLYQYQRGRILEEQKDLIIIKTLGGKRSLLQNIIMIEQLFLLLVGLLLSFIAMLVIIMFFLLEAGILPSLIVPIITFVAVVGVFSAISRWNIMKIMKRNHTVVNCAQI